MGLPFFKKILKFAAISAVYFKLSDITCPNIKTIKNISILVARGKDGLNRSYSWQKKGCISIKQ